MWLCDQSHGGTVDRLAGIGASSMRRNGSDVIKDNGVLIVKGACEPLIAKWEQYLRGRLDVLGTADGPMPVTVLLDSASGTT